MKDFLDTAIRPDSLGRMIYRFLGVIIALLLLLSMGPALAAGARAPAVASARKAAQITLLPPLVVNGRKIEMPVVLQMIKAALKRPWSSARKDDDVIVCRTPQRLGTHFERLRCQTNAQHYREAQATQMGFFLAESGGGGSIPAEDVTNSLDNLNLTALRVLLAKLPPANSSYTLQVTDHGQIVEKYVFKKGRLVRVWHGTENHEQKLDNGDH